MNSDSDHMWSVPRVVCHLETGMRRSRCTDQQIIAILAEQERRGPFRD